MFLHFCICDFFFHWATFLVKQKRFQNRESITYFSPPSIFVKNQIKGAKITKLLKQLSIPFNNYPGLDVFAPVYARGKSCCDGSGCFSFFHSTTIYLVFHGDPFSFTYCCDRLCTQFEFEGANFYRQPLRHSSVGQIQS